MRGRILAGTYSAYIQLTQAVIQISMNYAPAESPLASKEFMWPSAGMQFTLRGRSRYLKDTNNHNECRRAITTLHHSRPYNTFKDDLKLSTYGDLPMDAAAATGTLRSDEIFSFEDTLITELSQTRPMLRLKGIGFLGAIDYVKRGSGRSPNRRRHSRYEHSLCVAKLAEIYSMRADLKKKDSKLIMAAALLHDVGHGPLSHTLEPVFQEEFGINHHQTGQQIIRGETVLGRSIIDTLYKHSIDPEEVISLINGTHQDSYNFLFSSSINLDTLDGITRCSAFFGSKTSVGSANLMSNRLINQNNLPMTNLDEFWKMKHTVYNLFINSNIGLVFDGVAQTYMRDNIDQFRSDDFLLTERTIRSRHPYIFEMFRMLSTREGQLHSKLSKNLLATMLRVKRRKFFIDEHEQLIDTSSINKRYLQSKTAYSVLFGDIVESVLSRKKAK